MFYSSMFVLHSVRSGGTWEMGKTKRRERWKNKIKSKSYKCDVKKERLKREGTYKRISTWEKKIVDKMLI